MSQKQKNKSFNLKAAKDLFNEYIDKGQIKENIELPNDVVKIDDLNRKEVLSRLYKLVDDVLTKIYVTGRPSIQLPSRSGSNIRWD